MSSSNTIGEDDRGTAAPHDRLKAAVAHAAHFLPAQGPIGVFIHHNTLHAFQHLPFEQAVREAAKLFKTEPFLSEAAYRDELERGRIRKEDLDVVLAREPDADILPGVLTRRALRRVLLEPGLCPITEENVAWLTAEEGLTADAAVLRRLPAFAAPAARAARPREALLAMTGVDMDEAVHPWLIRFCMVFFDQGAAYWPMPSREEGFYRAAAEVAGQPWGLESGMLAGLGRAFRRQREEGFSSADVVLACLNNFRVPQSEWENFLTAELLALPGWAGLMRKLEEEPLLAPHKPAPCSLMDFLAVRLTLVEVAAGNVWAESGQTKPFWTQWLSPVAGKPETQASRLARAARLCEAAQLAGLSAGRLEMLEDEEFSRLLEEIESFNDWERRRIWHLAYERRHEDGILGPLLARRAAIDPRRPAGRPAAQVFFCIDEREESLRRALEEISPAVETLGAAGFFGVAVRYQGLDEPHGVDLCPVVVTPRHAVSEFPAEIDADAGRLRRLRRRLLGKIAHHGFVGSRTLLRGWVGALALGILALLPLAVRVASPRRAARARAYAAGLILPKPRTRVSLLRGEEKSSGEPGALLSGFSISEQAERVAGLLRGAGLIRGYSRLIAVLGHGSNSLNNPHESAHDCGACGGRRGAPNARLFAAMANDPRVRARLGELGTRLPEDTWFVGGYHDTCNDEIQFFDTDAVPGTHAAEFERLAGSLDKARAANALERARRFEAARDAETPEAALAHVEDRAEHLAEPRPEYGHATNAVCVVGRRSLTRGLFLDRRAFLVSYDPDCDENLASLSGLLGAAGPVCAGINLEYYFSFVDNARYGCGTKLPHNVTGLVGVMNGQAGDLLTGLPWQMVEVHEPVRLLLIVENSPERLMEAVRRSPVVTELVEKRWIRLAAMDPEGRLSVYRDGVFEPFAGGESSTDVSSSLEWYRGKIEHLPIARITSTSPHPEAS